MFLVIPSFLALFLCDLTWWLSGINLHFHLWFATLSVLLLCTNGSNKWKISRKLPLWMLEWTLHWSRWHYFDSSFPSSLLRFLSFSVWHSDRLVAQSHSYRRDHSRCSALSSSAAALLHLLRWYIKDQKKNCIPVLGMLWQEDWR